MPVVQSHQYNILAMLPVSSQRINMLPAQPPGLQKIRYRTMSEMHQLRLVFEQVVDGLNDIPLLGHNFIT